MSEITLEAITARQSELAEMIAKYKAPAPVTTVAHYAAVDIELHAGEHYAGAVLNADGSVAHHLVLMAEKPDDTLDWAAALAWAAGVGGALPTRQEAALIFANCKPHVEAVWHWTSETYEKNESCAWFCGFDNGHQGYGHKGNYYAARAVRRVNG